MISLSETLLSYFNQLSRNAARTGITGVSTKYTPKYGNATARSNAVIKQTLPSQKNVPRNISAEEQKTIGVKPKFRVTPLVKATK